MQEEKNYCLIEELVDEQIRIIIFDQEYQIVQYKLIEFNNSKLNNIYCGIIQKIDYGLESIFVILEENLSGFLPFKQLSDYYYDKSLKKLIKNIKKGDKILVQVVRDSYGTKLLKLTNNISITSKFCVYFPYDNYSYGISSNIKAEQRIMFKNFLNTLKNNNIKGSLIIRTSATEANAFEVEEDYMCLLKLYDEIQNKFLKLQKPKIIFCFDELIYILRSYSVFLLQTVFVRCNKLYKKINNYISLNLINFPNVRYNKKFKFLNALEAQVEQLYQKEIKLMSSGTIIIEKTEALISIDVNSNQSYKESNMEMTAFKTNFEAAHIIIKQILLRNLGGIIIIDLIDMQEEGHINEINDIFKKGFKNDKSSIKIVPINILGVLQISRERKGLSLIDKHYQKCHICDSGYIENNNSQISKFLYALSKYEHTDSLIIESNENFFELLLEKYSKIITKYKFLQWNIKDVLYFKISKN